jgi:AraC family transcriptional regulator
MSIVSQSIGCLRKIDFVDALLRSEGVVAQNSVTFEDPGALGIACVSYCGPIHTFKPANQAYHGIGYRICGAQTVRIDKPSSFPHGTGRSGMTAIVPANEESAWFSEGSHEMVHFYLASRLVSDLATEIYGVDGGNVEIQEAAFHIDETIGRYAMVFRERLHDPEPVTELELNAAAHLLGAHLLRRYSNLACRALPRVDHKLSLSTAQVRRITDYIVAHLDSGLRLSELAAVIGMKQFQFARAFQAATGQSPHRYIMNLRVARAQDLLAASSLSLSTIAAAAGFSSQSHMTLAFQRSFSITPGRYRTETGRLRTMGLRPSPRGSADEKRRGSDGRPGQ